jgi:hypothetical protein
MSYRDHLDYLPLFPGGPVGIYSATHPPCNEVVTAIVSIVAAVASAAISYDSAQTAAKQQEYNAQAQADAIGAEQQRQAAENEENRRRAVQEQRRFRASQLAAMGGSGAMLGTGTSLALEADTWAKQQTDLADQQRVNDLAQRNLSYQRSSTLEMGAQTAAGIRRDATGQAISGIASAAGQGYQAFSTRPQPAATSGVAVPSGYKPRNVSERPAGY